MPLSNKEIESKVAEVISVIILDTSLPPDQARVVHAASALLVNLLQNINDIAYYANRGGTPSP